jgi:hypothetical protein
VFAYYISNLFLQSVLELGGQREAGRKVWCISKTYFSCLFFLEGISQPGGINLETSTALSLL